jgi:putative MATE family efflux protein
MIWVGRLGMAAIAGVGAAGMGLMILMPAMMGLTMGARAMIARFIGAGDEPGANHVARQAFILGAGFSAVTAVIGIFFAESILRLLGMGDDVIREGAPYLRIVFVGSIALACRFIAEGIMQASGDTVTPMKITIGTRILHVVVCPFLVLGWWIFPRLGTSGAALTNTLSQSIGLSLALWVLFSGRTRIRLNLNNFRLDPGIIWRMVKIGFPALVSGLAQPFAQTLFMRIIASFGTMAVAAFTLGTRLQMLLFMPGVALGMAAGVLAGQNLGANQPERAEKSGWMAAGVVEVVMLIGSGVIVLWPDKLVGIFSADPDLVKTAGTFIKISVVGYLVMGASMVFMQCLMGVGDTVPPMALNLIMMWAVQLPLAFLLPRVTNLGMYAIPWSMVVGMYFGAIFFTIYFRLGRWKRKQV